MKMWCDSCKRAVEAEEKKACDELGYEYYLSECPLCGQDCPRYAETCVMCGEAINPESALCELCISDIRGFVNDVRHRRKLDRKNVISGIFYFAEYVEG